MGLPRACCPQRRAAGRSVQGQVWTAAAGFQVPPSCGLRRLLEAMLSSGLCLTFPLLPPWALLSSCKLGALGVLGLLDRSVTAALSSPSRIHRGLRWECRRRLPFHPHSQPLLVSWGVGEELSPRTQAGSLSGGPSTAPPPRECTGQTLLLWVPGRPGAGGGLGEHWQAHWAPCLSFVPNQLNLRGPSLLLKCLVSQSIPR